MQKKTESRTADRWRNWIIFHLIKYRAWLLYAYSIWHLVWKGNSKYGSAPVAQIQPGWFILKIQALSFCPAVPINQFRICHIQDTVCFISFLLLCNLHRVTSFFSLVLFQLFPVTALPSAKCAHSLVSQHSSHFSNTQQRKDRLDSHDGTNWKNNFHIKTKKHCSNENKSFATHGGQTHHVTGAVWFMITPLPVKTLKQFAV